MPLAVVVSSATWYADPRLAALLVGAMYGAGVVLCCWRERHDRRAVRTLQ